MLVNAAQILRDCRKVRRRQIYGHLNALVRPTLTPKAKRKLTLSLYRRSMKLKYKFVKAIGSRRGPNVASEIRGRPLTSCRQMAPGHA